MNLDLIALNNLSILSNIDNDTEFMNITDKIKLKTDKKDDSFKNIVELSGLEYMVHFTFHHVITLFEIQKTNSKRRYILDQMINALDNITEIYKEYINENERFRLILEHIEIVIEIINKNYYDNYLFYKWIEYCNYILDGFNHCKIIFTKPNRYINGFDRDIPYDSSSSDEEEEETEELDEQNIDKEIEEEEYKITDKMTKVLDEEIIEEEENIDKENIDKGIIEENIDISNSMINAISNIFKED
jgi:hypothetical protein